MNTPDELKPYRCDCEDGFLGPNCEGLYASIQIYLSYDSAYFLSGLFCFLLNKQDQDLPFGSIEFETK